MTLQEGFYAYVGSALGPGGLGARLRHHLKRAPRPRWHIDYLRHRLPLHSIWLVCDVDRLEHQWANALAMQPNMLIPMRGFGSSDCHCPAHLFHMEYPPTLITGREILGEKNLMEIQAACTGIE